MELANPEQQNLNFGIAKVSHKIQKTVTIVNRGKKDVIVGLSRSLRKMQQNAVTYAVPADDLKLAPKQSYDIEFTFHPRMRVAAFSEEFLVDAAGECTLMQCW